MPSSRDQPVGQRARAEQLLELGKLRLERAAGQVGPLEQLAEPLPELGLERGHRQEPAVRRLVDPVAGDTAGEQARHRVAGQAVRDEAVRAVRHRDDDARAVASALAFEQRRENLDHRALGAGGEVGDLHRRQRRRGVGEDARVAEVVQVVPRVDRVRAIRAEAGDRAEDRRRGQLDAEALPDAWPEALEHHVRLEHRRRAAARSPRPRR